MVQYIQVGIVMSETIGPDEDILPGLGYLVADMMAMLADLAKEKFAPFEISPMQFAILYMCWRGQRDTVTALTRVIPVDPASISRHVAALIERGLMRRIHLENDRRVVRLELTEEGQALVPELTASLQEANPILSVGLDEEEKRVFLGVMPKIRKNLENLAGVATPGD